MVFCRMVDVLGKVRVSSPFLFYFILLRPVFPISILSPRIWVPGQPESQMLRFACEPHADSGGYFLRVIQTSAPCRKFQETSQRCNVGGTRPQLPVASLQARGSSGKKCRT